MDIQSIPMVRSESLADIISYLLSPASIAGYIILFFAFSRIHMENIVDLFILITLAIIFLCITPIIGILIYTKKGVIDIWVSDRKIRTKFYIVAIIGYLVGAVIFLYMNQHEFFVFTLAYLAVTLAITMINFKTKISSHIAGFSGPCTAVVYLFGISAVFLFLLLPVLMWARLELNAHSLSQLIGGGIIGVIVTLSTYLLFY